MELKFDLFLYYTAWICWHFNFAINVWDHKLLWYFIYKLWTLYNFCHAGCWHILLWIKKKNVLPELCKKKQKKTQTFPLCAHRTLSLGNPLHVISTSRCQQIQPVQYTSQQAKTCFCRVNTHTQCSRCIQATTDYVSNQIKVNNKKMVSNTEMCSRLDCISVKHPHYTWAHMKAGPQRKGSPWSLDCCGGCDCCCGGAGLHNSRSEKKNRHDCTIFRNTSSVVMSVEGTELFAKASFFYLAGVRIFCTYFLFSS